MVLQSTFHGKWRETQEDPNSISDLEYRVFSQFGDDGIIQYLARKIPPDQKTFVEFGVENYQESNTRLLLERDNWSGLIIDGSSHHVEFIRKRTNFWRYDLTAIDAFITSENVNELFQASGFTGNIGLLSIDIDGNDYWIWDAITVASPAIVICEYNSIFGKTATITIPYARDFVRGKAHYSNLYQGASLGALCHLADKKGYGFVGCNSAGNNAYFVKKSMNTGLPVLTLEEGFVRSKFREAREENGRLLLKPASQCIHLIQNLPVVDVRSGKILKLIDVLVD
jgi:hypothetical protein